MKRILFYITIVLLLFACEEGTENENILPDTFLSVDTINLDGDDRLNSRVRLSWFGTDKDGYVIGYEISTDQMNWDFVTTQDSVFVFNLAAGADTADIDFYIRAVDNENGLDPSPDELRIPIRNTPPVIAFDDNLTIEDSTFLVATTSYAATDLDGDATIEKVMISLNGDTWVEINRFRTTFSIAPANPNANGLTDAVIYYDNDNNAAPITIPGLQLNDTNRILIKAVDQAGSESVPDTTNSFYMVGREHDVLMIGGLASNAATIYQGILNQINVDYDYLDLVRTEGIYRSKIWNITFKLQLSFYQKIVFFSNETIFPNNFTNTSGLLLEFAAFSLQEYANQGGKYLITTAFNYSTNIDGFSGVIPIERFAESNTGNVRMLNDSAIVPTQPNYPSLSPTDFAIVGVDVFYNTQDSEVFYTAQIRTPSNWVGPKIIASARRDGAKFNQIFFGVELWRMNDDPAELNALFNQILNVEFN